MQLTKKPGLPAIAALLAFSSSQAFAQQPPHCEVSGQVASLGVYSSYAYFRLKNDPRLFIFFKVKPEVVALRMALLQSAYVSGSTVCFEGATRLNDSEMQSSIPQVVTSFNTPMDSIFIPRMSNISVYRADAR